MVIKLLVKINLRPYQAEILEVPIKQNIKPITINSFILNNNQKTIIHNLKQHCQAEALEAKLKKLLHFKNKKYVKF